MTEIPQTLPVLVVGATGFLGGKVVTELLNGGHSVRALVRSTTDASRLESQGVEIARGDMLEFDSLVAAMHGADAVVTTPPATPAAASTRTTSTPSATPTSPRRPTGPGSGGSS